MSQNSRLIAADCILPAGFLRDRVVLITGAGDGIGKALSLAAAEHGATVILLDKNVRKLELVYDELDARSVPQPAIYPLNLETATPEHYQELATTIQEQLGGLDVLIHNAASLGKLAPVEHTSIDVWFSTLQSNLTGPFLLTQACLPMLKSAERADILFISDAVGRAGRAYWSAYGVSKFALEGFMQILAAEQANRPELRVNSIDPGTVRTGLRRSAYPGEDAEQHPLPEQIAPALLYPLTPDAGEASGVQYTVA